MNNLEIEDINEYYTNKVLQFGRSPEGVDWNGVESQYNRFEQLSKVFQNETITSFSVLDYGCGFGSYFTYLKDKNTDISYTGFDISEEMIKNAKLEFQDENCFYISLERDYKSDYVVASGIFNVKLQNTDESWQNYILSTLNEFNRIAVKGFAFNILSSYSDFEFMKNYLFYASPEFYFSYCKKNFSKEVSLLHDYGLYEFTILVKK